MMHNMAMQKETFVWWDIKSCPIPDGFDPCLVGRRIESALRKSGYSGCVTITAAGNLRESPGEDIMRKLSSTGIALTDATEPTSVLRDWTRTNRSPATIMLIFGGPKELELLAHTLYYLRDTGYRILLAYHQRDPAWRWKSFLLNVSKEWLWKSLLSDDMDSGSADNKHKTTRLVLQDKYTEKGKSPWYCRVCCFAGRSFEHFSTHLKSENMHIMSGTCSILNFQVSDKRWYWLKVFALATIKDWEALEKFSKEKRPPTGFRPFVEACIDADDKAEALKYIPKLSDLVERGEAYARIGMAKEAADAAAQANDGGELLERFRKTFSQNAIFDTLKMPFQGVS